MDCVVIAHSIEDMNGPPRSYRISTRISHETMLSSASLPWGSIPRAPLFGEHALRDEARLGSDRPGHPLGQPRSLVASLRPHHHVHPTAEARGEERGALEGQAVLEAVEAQAVA